MFFEEYSEILKKPNDYFLTILNFISLRPGVFKTSNIKNKKREKLI